MPPSRRGTRLISIPSLLRGHTCGNSLFLCFLVGGISLPSCFSFHGRVGIWVIYARHLETMTLVVWVGSVPTETLLNTYSFTKLTSNFKTKLVSRRSPTNSFRKTQQKPDSQHLLGKSMRDCIINEVLTCSCLGLTMSPSRRGTQLISIPSLLRGQTCGKSLPLFLGGGIFFPTTVFSFHRRVAIWVIYCHLEQ
ncbi:hypothetical protein CEXT_373991 [Caerostris extrusa]|uniref:Cytochrome c biogenesis B n=1 Tax=Caerostris extrusa TaxID=172846 RepID=A0AAV4PR73_CAEEX|nr:hypothetical protein CEXT_373991 [Caerostris extrusa]